jgi:hypothetical protein
MYRIESKLQMIAVADLRPTQMTIGLKEVARKRQQWAAMGKKKRRAAMTEMLFPAVIGPGKAYYILDHHHSAVALVKERAHDVQVGIVKDLSALELGDFWIYLDHLSWVHPYDQKGKRRAFEQIPSSFKALRDDPYRSLAGEVRDLGGFSKSDAPFLEFLWTNYFRANVRAGWVRSHYPKALRRAMRLAHSTKTQYLPGWVGKRRGTKP